MGKGINVLSLFDGMSCGKLALERNIIKVENYYTSEVDKYAEAVSKYNFPDTIQLGDVKNWKEWDIDWSSINLLIGGSPCQNFSFSGKQKGMATKTGEEILTLDRYLELKAEGFQFEGQSYLFWEYISILEHIKKFNPEVKFLLENVKMVSKWSDLISSVIDTDFIEINSDLVSAQRRKRLYWTNIEGIVAPIDKGILLKDIVHETIDEEIHIDKFNVNPSGKGMNGSVYSVHMAKSSTLTTNKGEGQKIAIPLEEYKVPFDKTLQILDKEVEKGKLGFFRKDSQANRVYFIHGKSVTLTGMSGGGAAKMGQYLFGCITPDRLNKRQNGQRFNDGKKFYTLTAQDKHGVLIEGYIRKLTPIECERLQTVPEGFTRVGIFNGEVKPISNSQRYKMLGNGWTVDVIAHIFKNLPIKS